MFYLVKFYECTIVYHMLNLDHRIGVWRNDTQLMHASLGTCIFRLCDYYITLCTLAFVSIKYEDTKHASHVRMQALTSGKLSFQGLLLI